jgi:hypothetical protein
MKLIKEIGTTGKPRYQRLGLFACNGCDTEYTRQYSVSKYKEEEDRLFTKMSNL